MIPYHLSRRRFLVRAAITLTALPLLTTAVSSPALAALPSLPLDNPQARALSYTDDTSKTKYPAFKPGSACANCQFFTAATGACALFPGFSVKPAGWCSAWAKKA